MKGIKRALAEAFEQGFHSTNTGVSSAFFHFLEIGLTEIIHQDAVDSLLTKSIDRLIHSDVHVSASVGKIGAQSLHSQVVPIKFISSGKIKSVASKDVQLVASLSPLDT